MNARAAAATLLVAMLLNACAAAPTSEVASDEPQFSSDEAALNYHLTLGDLALRQRDYPAAADAYLRAMVLTDEVAVAEQATGLSLMSDRFDDADRAAARWQELAPSSQRAAEARLLIALHTDNPQAEAHLRRVLSLRGAPAPSAFQAVARILFEVAGHESTRRLMAEVAAEYDTPHAWHATALVALRADDLELARRAVDRGRGLDPNWAQLAMLEARLLILEGDPDGGVALMQALADENPNDTTLRFALGGLYLTMGRDEEALVELRTVVEATPDYLDARWTLAMLLMQLREPQQAVPHLEALMADPERRWDVPYYLGGAYEMMEDWATALEWFDGVEWGDNLVNAGIKSAQMLFNLDRVGEARARLDELRALHPEEGPRLYRVESELLLQHNDAQAALGVLDAGVRAHPDSLPLRYTRALLREQEGQMDGAIEDLRWVYNLHPDDHEAQNALGYTLADRGAVSELAEARDLIERAVVAQPDNPAYLDSMGWVLYRLGDLEAALDWLQRSWALDRNPEVGAHIGEVLWQMGDQDAARAIWDEAAAVDAEHRVLVETRQRLDP